MSTVEVSKQEEQELVQSHLIRGVGEMTKFTQKVYMLSVCLNERDPQCKSVYQTVYEQDEPACLA